LKKLQCPTLVLVGEEDMTAFKRSAELVLRNLPGSRRIYLAATGHLSLLERPAVIAPLLVAHWRQAAARRREFLPREANERPVDLAKS
jgi:pimeloyl-ACP methyl ester carboxylesterase